MSGIMEPAITTVSITNMEDTIDDMLSYTDDMLSYAIEDMLFYTDDHVATAATSNNADLIDAQEIILAATTSDHVNLLAAASFDDTNVIGTSDHVSLLAAASSDDTNHLTRMSSAPVVM